MKSPTALIADDEPLLRESLTRALAEIWPELTVVATAKNGRLAVESFEALRPDVCFLDVQMPGLTGIEAARFIGRRAHIVFVTAFNQYAVEAFNQGAIDYLVKPVEIMRLRDTITRIKSRIYAAEQAPDTASLLDQLAARLYKNAPAKHTRWLCVAVGQVLKMVSIDEVDFFRAEDKYTLVAWHDSTGRLCEGLVRTSLKELASQLDPAQFIQTHRAVMVNLHAVQEVRRGQNETASITLKNRSEILPVSRTFLHYFKITA
jgi:DNA-binding LytR/AlgR family response regulator